MKFQPSELKASERLILSLADDEFILGYRDSEWTGIAPMIEEDIAFSSIAQDEIGHARALYELLETRTGHTADSIAFGRSPVQYLNCKLVEHPREDWGFAIARQYLYDTAEHIRTTVLMRSSDKALSQIMEKIAREEKYHLLHTRTWIERLAQGPINETNEGRRRLEIGLKKAWPHAQGIFEPLFDEEALLRSGVLSESMMSMQERFQAEVKGFLARFSLGLEQAEPIYGGRQGEHTTAFSTLWAEMTLVYRQAPEAVW